MINDIVIVQLVPQHAVVVSQDVDQHEIGEFVGRAFPAVMAALQKNDMGPTGIPFARYAMIPDGFHIEAGFPCDRFPGHPGVEAIELPGGLAAQVTHTGPYVAVSSAYRALEAWMQQHHLVPRSGPWESYLDGPEVAEPRTVITWPCQPA